MTLPRERSTSCRPSPMRSGAEIPWEVDGLSLLEEPVPDRPLEIENLREGGVEITAAEFRRARDEALQDRIGLLGDGTTSLYEIGPSTELHGRLVEPLIAEDAGGEAKIVDGDAVKDYDPDSEEIPARIAGDVNGVDPGEPMAIALNGRVAATTYAYEGERGTEFSAMVPPALIEAGDNELTVFAIEGEGAGATLHPLDVSF